MGQRIASARQAKRLTQQQLAERLGVSRVAVTQWEADKHAPRDRLDEIAEALGVAFDWLRTGRGQPQPPAEASQMLTDPHIFQPRLIAVNSPKTLDLPVLGTAMGGPNGFFELQCVTIEHVRRPPHLATVQNAFALYVAGLSMSPRYEPGELIYCRLGRHPRPGNYVVLEMLPEHDGAPIMATIGRYKRLAGNYIEIEKLNPPSVQKVPAAKINRIHVIVGTGEP